MNHYLVIINLLNDENQGYFILERALFHFDEDLIKDMKDIDRGISITPGKMTRFFQPLEVSINKLFKKILEKNI